MEGVLGTIGDRDLHGFDLSSHLPVVISRFLTHALLCDSGVGSAQFPAFCLKFLLKYS